MKFVGVFCGAQDPYVGVIGLRKVQDLLAFIMVL